MLRKRYSIFSTRRSVFIVLQDVVKRTGHESAHVPFGCPSDGFAYRSVPYSMVRRKGTPGGEQKRSSLPSLHQRSCGYVRNLGTVY